MHEYTVGLEDGRVLRVREDGDAAGRSIFSLHGTPGSRLLYPQHVEDARSKGLRLIGYDRPGYGGSSTQRGRNHANVAADVVAIADFLGIDRFGVWGHSGGGAPALACAALLPDRVVGAVSLAGVAPFGVPGLDFLGGMGELNVEDFQLMLRDRPAWEAKTEQDAAILTKATIEELEQMLASLISDVDRSVLTREVAEFMQAEGREGLREHGDGMRDDNLSDVAPWGFDLASIRIPTQIWHGGQDKFVPYSHGQWLATHVPGTEAHLDPSEGHLTLFLRKLPDVHAWLASKF